MMALEVCGRLGASAQEVTVLLLEVWVVGKAEPQEVVLMD